MLPRIKFGLVIAALLAVTLTTPHLCGQGGKPPSEYAALRDRVKSGDLTVDFMRLRVSYIESPERKNALDTSVQSTKMADANKARDFKLSILNADAVLESNYTDMDAHFYEFLAYRELGNAKLAQFHRTVFQKLVQSILDSGDGKTPATAYVVVSVHEEYVVMSALGLQPQGQSLLHDKGHSYDVMKAKDKKSGEAVALYFNADIAFESYKLNMK